MRDPSQRARAIRRLVGMATAQLEQKLVGLIEWAAIRSVSTGDGSVPVGASDGDEKVQILEQYGFASGPPGDAIGLVFAPGGELSDRVALGVSSVAGRPATASGDSVQWTGSGHSVLLEEDGDLTITSKDGSTVVLGSAGQITISAGPLASVTVNVDVGQSVNVGGPGAVALTKWQALLTAMTALLAAGALAPGSGGAAFALAQTAWQNAIGLLSPATTKAKGE